MRIHKAQPDEATALTDLAIRSKRSWGYSDEFMEKVMPDMIVHRKFLEEEHGIVAQEGGETLGYAIVRVDSDEAFLRDLFIEPVHFWKGIGKVLFEESLHDAGAARIRLLGDPSAIGFYERLGIRKIEEEPSIVGGGRAPPIMAIELAAEASQH